MDTRNLHNIVFTLGRLCPDGIALLGTCFLINRPNLFVTASHVTSNDDNNLVICLPKIDVDGYQDTSDARIRYAPVKIVKSDPVRDICILEGKFNGVVSSIDALGSDSIHPCDKLTIVGFPHCTQGRDVLTCQDATVGAKILIESCGIKSKHIVINIQTRDGQSGSPVFRDSDSKLVAMIIGSYAPGKGAISLGGHRSTDVASNNTCHICRVYITNVVDYVIR